jgi:hypothetical protein
VKPKWLPDGNGMTHPGLRFVGGNYIDMSEILYRLYEVAYAGGADAVVVSNENDGFVFGHPGFRRGPGLFFLWGAHLL